MGRKFRGWLGTHLTQSPLGWGLSPCQVPSWSIQPIGHNKHGPNFFFLGGGSAPFLGRGAGSPSNAKLPRPRPSSMPSGILIHASIWSQQIWAENGGLCPFRGGRAGSPPNRMWPEPRPTYTPSFVLIRPAVWTQYTNVIDRQDRTGQTDRQRADSIGRTVLQTVAQKLDRNVAAACPLQQIGNEICNRIV